MLINRPGLLSRAEHSSSLGFGTQQWHPRWPWQAWRWLSALSPGFLLAAGCSLLGRGASKFQLRLIPQLWSKDTEAPKSRSPSCAITNLSPWGAQPPPEQQAQPGWHGLAAWLWPILPRELLNCKTEPWLQKGKNKKIRIKGRVVETRTISSTRIQEEKYQCGKLYNPKVSKTQLTLVSCQCHHINRPSEWWVDAHSFLDGSLASRLRVFCQGVGTH